MTGRDKDSYNIRSVENALHLLEALAEEETHCSLAQLSQRLDMTKASLFRLMATFENHGYIERGPHAGEYQLGMAAFEVSQKLLSKMTLLRKARPVMAHLVRQCDETVYLLVQRDMDILFMEMMDNDQKVKVVPLTSQRFPLDSCGPGYIFLAFDNANKKLLERRPHLTEKINECRQLRYCIDHNGLGEGSTCLAAPLFSAGEALVGSLALVAPSFRMDEQRINKELLPALKAASEMVSARLGYNTYTSQALS